MMMMMMMMMMMVRMVRMRMIVLDASFLPRLVSKVEVSRYLFPSRRGFSRDREVYRPNHP